MFLITCPVTRSDHLVSLTSIRSVINHPTHIAVHVECPDCGALHEHRTGRKYLAARRAEELVAA